MNRFIEQTKEHIKKNYPQVSHVEIRTTRAEDGSFTSKILVTTPGVKFFAQKKEATYKASLDKSYHAISHQLDKLKTKRSKKNYSPRDVLVA